MENILSVQGSQLPEPTKMTLGDYDISDSERNANGYMISQMIRANVHKLECQWAYLTPNEYMQIRNAIRGTYGLSVSFFIADEDTQDSLTMYAGDRSTPYYYYKDGKPTYKDFKVNFIEE